MKKLFIADTVDKVGETVELYGWVHRVRDHKGVVFVDLRDRTGVVQVVGGSELAKASPEDVVHITGTVKRRPEHMVNPKLKTGTVEVKVKEFEIVSHAKPLPFDFAKEELDVTLPTLLNWRTITLRHPKVQLIFKIQEAVMEGFRNATQELECVEVFVPTISAQSTEGGADVFKVQYFDYDAYLVQSPQLYKQIMVPVFERVYLISHAYRAEPSVTTRHLTESTQMDCELGFFSFDELIDAYESVARKMLGYVAKKHTDSFSVFDVDSPRIPKKIPRLTLREAQKIIKERTSRNCKDEPDLSPEDEREVGVWAKEKHDSDLVTITHFPIHKRAFYTEPDPNDPKYSLSYDLLFRGAEILSGSQRIYEYDKLVATIKERGMDPKDFSLYLQAFEYGMPPHGGFSFGLERLTMMLLGLPNIRQASLFPRDMERIDIHLPTHKNHGKKEPSKKTKS
ncbi:MAG: aspartate--tRNA(Asn) ligase [Candidatus Paceibacterota bacterium]